MPFVVASAPVMNRALVRQLMTALTARPAAALLATPTVRLFTAGPSPITPDVAAVDFTEATFSGYAAFNLAFSVGVINLPSGDGLGIQGDADYFCNAAFPGGETILGYWVEDGSGTIYQAEYFPAPVVILNSGDFVSIDNIFGINFSVPTS